MRIRPSNHSGGVAIELSPKETQIPSPPSPFKLQKILAPTDFSSCSHKALQYAEAVAKQFNAEIILLHVMQHYMPVTDFILVDTTALIDEARVVAKQDLEALRTALDRQTRSRVLTRSGEPYNEIVAAARELEVDLIIISTHGRTGLAHTFMGSTTERVVRHAHCPVLVAREHEHEFLKTSGLNREKHENMERRE